MTPNKKRHVYQQKHQPQPKQQKAIPMRKSRKKLWIALALLAILFISTGGYYMIVQGQNQSQNQVPNASPTRHQRQVQQHAELQARQLKNKSITAHQHGRHNPSAVRNDKPITTANFINLVKQGKYDGTIFHRIMVGFMIQGGARLADHQFQPYKTRLARTIVTSIHIAMANTGQPNSATSQFFINVADND